MPTCGRVETGRSGLDPRAFTRVDGTRELPESREPAMGFPGGGGADLGQCNVITKPLIERLTYMGDMSSLCLRRGLCLIRLLDCTR